MKTQIQTIAILVLLLISITLSAQNKIITRQIISTEIQTPEGKAPPPGMLSEVVPDYGPCITKEQELEIQKQIDVNVERLKREHPGLLRKPSSNGTPHPLFSWPTRPKAGFDDYGYYTVNFLVDHDPVFPNHLLDYNCGARTYDFGSGNHAGTDIILWPYAWRRMDEQVMEVIAAAPGVIVNKVDGNYDRNCSNNGSGTWNQINVRQADGSTAWYLHFKSGSLTSKGVGDSVATGEYLGTAGSSGSSSWPHLHFQVMDSTNSLIDPWQGTCNNLNTDSWWLNQQDYNVPTINHICTKKTVRDFYECPDPEITYEADTFNIGDSLWIWVYTRDLVLNSTMQINIYNPSGQNVLNFPFTSPWPTMATSYIRWYYMVDSWFVPGVWTYEVVYDGNTYQHQFLITGTAVGINQNDRIPDFAVWPNPSTGNLQLSFSNTGNLNSSIEILNMLGEPVLRRNILSHPGVNWVTMDDLNLDKGVYILKLNSGNTVATKKIILQ